MNTRNTTRIDYEVYDDSGDKVPRNTESHAMDDVAILAKLKVEELKVRADIDHLLEVNDLDDLDDVDEIVNAATDISEISQRFRHLHVDLGTLLVEDYATAYPDYKIVSQKLTNFSKEARKKIKRLKADSAESEVKREQACAVTEAREKIGIEADLIATKFKNINDSAKIFPLSMEVIDDFSVKMNELLKDGYDLDKRARFAFGPEAYELQFGMSLESFCREVTEELKMAKLLKQKLGEYKTKNCGSEPQDFESRCHILNAKSIYSEIILRCEALETKLDVDLNSLGDYQLLEINQKNLDKEFNAVLEKVTSLATLVRLGGIPVQNLLQESVTVREALAVKKKKFNQLLSELVTKRDVTADKLKNASLLKIEIPKFSGYDSKMDVYTFKSEFKKLVEPIIKNSNWPDYLKRNYLSGSALTLVEKETEYEKIWEKLVDSYGNVRYLLQNKLCELDKIGGLWKIKSDEKFLVALAKLTNSMKEISRLAKEHDIEGQLYEGGGLEKVLCLIGDGRHKRFREKNLNLKSKKDEWVKLFDFLQHEYKVRERINFDNKNAQLMGIRQSKGDSSAEKKSPDEHSSKSGGGIPLINHTGKPSGQKCHICDMDDHVVIKTAKGKLIIPYYVCEKFVKMSMKSRRETLVGKNLCTGCMFPGAQVGPRHKCFFVQFCCPHPSHTEKIHILLCEEHKAQADNVKIFEKFKEKFIEQCKVQLPVFTKTLMFFSEMIGHTEWKDISFGFDCEVPLKDAAIFLLQRIEFAGITLNIFYDGGCGDSVVKKSAVDKLAAIGRAQQVLPGPFQVKGVGDTVVEVEFGVVTVCIPLLNGRNALITGSCMGKITSEFPTYNLGEVEKDIRSACDKDLLKKLPSVPSQVGGETDILLGIKYARYFPKEIFRMESGLSICESAFRSPCGSTGVIGGPHPKFSEIERQSGGHHVDATSYFTSPVLLLRTVASVLDSIPLLGYDVTPSMRQVDDPSFFSSSSPKGYGPVYISHSQAKSVVSEVKETTGVERADVPYTPPAQLDYEECEDCRACITCHRSPVENQVYIGRRPPKCVKQFDEVEAAGTDITYRCVDCRSCTKCKNGSRIESMSIQAENEQDVIEKAVVVDTVKNITQAKLPFLVDPDTRLVPNESDALRVFKKQVKILNLKPEDKAAVLEFEKKLQDMGFVDYVSNLDDVIKNEILSNVVKYFIPWRAHYNEKSLSTPCRMVFDASMGSKNGCSLNSLLAKGSNSLNNLVQIAIRWQFYRVAFHTDVTKMYNRVMLDQAHWRYQLYLWVDGLAEGVEPVWKVIKTLIYGVRSSGNLAECALRRSAELFESEFPKASKAVLFDTYMDDCISGGTSLEDAKTITDQLVVGMARTGFSYKGFSFAGEDPPEHLTKDGESVLVAGQKWFCKGDFVKLNIKEFNFNKKCRGRKAKSDAKLASDDITMLNCQSVVGEIFDLLGHVAPIVGGLKIDLSILHKRKIGWDDPIPSELKEIWAANFDLIEELSTLQFRRAVVPEDACSLDVETIDVGDAGENLVCAAIYARFKLRGGGYSCQLVFARTKIVHDHTIPRAELIAAVLNASTGHVVRLSLKDLLKRHWKLTDSQVVLHWINTTKTKLKQFIRNKGIEVTRLTNREDWRYVPSKLNVADIGTRKGAQIADVGPESPWSCGLPWMRESEENFPLKTVKEIILAGTEKSNFEKECVVDNILATFNVQCFVKYVPNELGDRYKFSNYLLDPNKFRFRTVIRILSLVLLFIKKCNKKRVFSFMKNPKFSSIHMTELYGRYAVAYPVKVKPGTNVAVVHISDEMLLAAKMYYFRKCTLEIQKFVDPSKYRNNSTLHDGVLYHTGRILSTQEVDGSLSLGDVCLDLSASTFCVPMVDSLSPVAYAIVSETHWHHPDVKHGGIESVLRFSQMTAYIIGGRDLAKSMKKACAKCRILHKKGVQVAMGPLSDQNLCIAPPFYFCQVDICGPLSAFSPANKRATLKVWFVVFCCTTTGTVDLRIMEDYSADSFVEAFERFSCRFGYPKMVLPDEGSQLVRGCEGMVLSFSDISQKLSREYGIEFKTCPVGAHNVHGKVERKIQEVRKSIRKDVVKKKLSILQWETLGQQISNSINNLPLCIGNKTEMIENLDILTPNRLILGRNNNRCPTEPLKLEPDLKGIIENNSNIFGVWFKEWLTSVVPSLIEKPKWFVTERHVAVGDIVLFLKSDKEFEKQYQYGVISAVYESKDGLIRTVLVEYQNHGENVKRTTRRSVRDLVVIHPIEELGIMKELHDFASSI